MQSLKCELCNGETHEDTVKMSLWEGDRLVLIEDVPARVCEKCAEQYYDDRTLHRLDALRGRRFPVSEANRMTEVAVFSLSGANVTAGADMDESG